MREQLWSAVLAGIDLSGRQVLDAGTGEGRFTRFLAARGPAKLISITCRPEEVTPARAYLGPLADRVEFQIADLSAMPEIPGASFDFVGADFLIAAVAALRPFREIECLQELDRVLRPGGRIVVIGWDVQPAASGSDSRVLLRLLALRDAASRLAGRHPFREHPRSWVVARLQEFGLVIERVLDVPDLHHDLGWLHQGTAASLEAVDSVSLREALADELGRIESEVRVLLGSSGLEFGRLYAVLASKPTGKLSWPPPC